MKTTKEKAQEILDKYKSIMPGYTDHWRIKECALIAVDEMIVLNGDFWLRQKLDKMEYVITNDYLFNVKTEIEKL